MKKRSSNKSISSIEAGLQALEKTPPDYSIWKDRLQSRFSSAVIDFEAVWESLPNSIGQSNFQLLSKWQFIDAARRAKFTQPTGSPIGQPPSEIQIGLECLLSTEPDYFIWEKWLKSQLSSKGLDAEAIWKLLPVSIFRWNQNSELIAKWHLIESARTLATDENNGSKSEYVSDRSEVPHLSDVDYIPSAIDSEEFNDSIADVSQSGNMQITGFDWITHHPLSASCLLGTMIGWLMSPFGWFFPIIFLLSIAILLVRALSGKTWGKTSLTFAFMAGFIVTGITHDLFFDHPTAECRDGSYSYSAHHQGTCSWHHGVAVWNPDRSHWWQGVIR